MDSNSSLNNPDQYPKPAEINKESENAKNKASADFQAQVDKIKSLFDSLSAAKNKNQDSVKWKILEDSKSKGYSIVQNIIRKEFSFTLKRLIDTNDIINSIRDYQQNLTWKHYECPNKATQAFIKENGDLMFCDAHANLAGHQTIPVKFANELSSSEDILNSLEKHLVLLQVEIAFIKSEKSENRSDLFEDMMKELDRNYKALENNLSNKMNKVMSITKNAKSEAIKKENSKYESFDFINTEWDKSNQMIIEILSIITKMQIFYKTNYIIQHMLNESTGLQNEEEFKVISENKVPDWIYDKEYTMIDTFIQPKSEISRIDTEIKNWAKYIENNDKVYID